MWATRAQAIALAMVALKSFASQRHRPIHAKVLSTTHLRAQNFESLCHVRTFDDFDLPFADALQSLAQFISGIATIGKDIAKPWIAGANRCRDARGAVAILNAGFMHDKPDEISFGVGDNVAIAPLDFLACIVAPGAAAFRCFTDWLSITPAVGLASRPAASRDAITRV
jgi:hypothetical protein